MARSKQVSSLLHYLKSGERITQLEALKLFSIGRLAARIKDLRNEGHDIRSEMVEVQKGDGSKARVARYALLVPAGPLWDGGTP